MAEAIEGHVKYGTEVIELDLNHRRIRMSDGEYCEAEKIITTIPWNSLWKITYFLTAEEVRGILERGEVVQSMMAAPLWRLAATLGL